MALADGTRDDAAAGAPRSLWALYTRVRAAKRAAPYASSAGMFVAFSSSSAAAAAAAAPPASRVARLTALLRLFAVATLAAQFYAVASGDSPPTASVISIAQWIDLRSVVTLRLALLCAGVAVASRLGAQYDAFAMLQIAGDGAAGGRAAHRWWLLPRWGLGAYEAPAVMGWQLAVGVVLALAPPTTPLVDDGGDGPDVAYLGVACYGIVVLCLRHLTRTHLQRADPGSVDGGDDGARAALHVALADALRRAAAAPAATAAAPAAAAATPAAERAELSQVLRGGADLGAAAALTSPSFSPLGAALMSPGADEASILAEVNTKLARQGSAEVSGDEATLLQQLIAVERRAAAAAADTTVAWYCLDGAQRQHGPMDQRQLEVRLAASRLTAGDVPGVELGAPGMDGRGRGACSGTRRRRRCRRAARADLAGGCRRAARVAAAAAAAAPYVDLAAGGAAAARLDPRVRAAPAAGRRQGRRARRARRIRSCKRYKVCGESPHGHTRG